MAKIGRKKSAHRIKKASCGKTHHKKIKRTRKPKKSFLDKLLDIFD